jgi:hypothetical protein
MNFMRKSIFFFLLVLLIDPAWPRAGSRGYPRSARTSRSATRGNFHSRRSRAARDAFERTHPCPATGRTSGPCRGYVVDHIQPLACGGADAPGNMQWQTKAEGKAKDKWERAGCQVK